MSKRNRDRSVAKSEPAKTEASDAGSAENIRSKIYDEYRRELTVKQNSNSENYDKSILTLSSAGLGLSLAFIKDIVPLARVHDHSMLLASWSFFAAAIVITLVSFQCSQRAIQRALDDAEKYYLKNIEEYQTKNNPWNTATSWLNSISGIAFVLAVLATAVFVFTNLPAKQNEPTTAKTIAPAVTPAGGHPPASPAQHGPTSQPATSNSPTPKKVTP